MESARARLVKLADKAVDVVEDSLNCRDEKVALKVLHGVCALRKRGRGSVNPEALQLKMELRDKRELRRAEMAMLRHLLKKAGMPAEQCKRVLAGGAEAAKVLAGVRQERAQREAAAAGPPAGREAKPGLPGHVTSNEGGQTSAGEVSSDEESNNPLDFNQLGMNMLGNFEQIGDVTSDVTEEEV